MRGALTALALLAATPLAACSNSPSEGVPVPPANSPERTSSPGDGVPTASPASAGGQPRLPTTQGRVGAVPLELELATTSEQRAAGLRDRVVPPGTGMAFVYDRPAPVRFTMSGVEDPLVAVFAAGGRAVSVEQLVPCPGTVQECPTYGPPTPVDLVVEVAPGTLPDARPGDEVVLQR